MGAGARRGSFFGVAVLFGTGATLAAYAYAASVFDERNDFFVAVAVRALVLAGGPLIAIRSLGGPLADFGIGRGSTSLRSLVPLLAVAIALGIVASRLPGAHALYPRFAPARTSVAMFAASTLVSGAEHAGWEMLFRGFLLFGLAKRWGKTAIVLAAVPFAAMHLPKGLVETAVAFPGGVLCGMLAWRARSFVPAFLVHWTIATTVNAAVVLWS